MMRRDRPPEKRAAGREGYPDAAAEGMLLGVELEHTALLDARTVCACYRRAIPGASPALLGAHAVCWHAAGERIRRVSRAAIERQHQAEITAWRDEYQRAELELQAEGWL